MDISDQKRILDSVKESITETTQKTEEAASYFIIGLASAIIVAVIIVLAAVSGKSAQIETYDQQIKTDVTDQLKNLEKEQKQISSVFTQLDALETSLTKRLKYSQVLTDLGKNQYQKSRWTSITVKNDAVSISGEADGFEDVAKTVVGLKNMKSIKSVKLTSATLNQEKAVVAYVIDLTVDLKEYKNSLTNKPEVSPTAEAQQ